MYCISCGTKAARWPKDAPVCCTMHCAANQLLTVYRASPDNFHCPDCGGSDSFHCLDCGASEQAEETVEEAVRENWMDRLLRRKS